MTKEIILVNNTVPQTISGKISEILSEAVLRKAYSYIREYETETDAQLFTHGLVAIKDMLQYADKLAVNKTSTEFSLIKDELRLRIKQVDTIILRARGKRPAPQLSNDDAKTVLEIGQAFNKFFGTRGAISFENIAPLLLEASKDEKNHIS